MRGSACISVVATSVLLLAWGVSRPPAAAAAQASVTATLPGLIAWCLALVALGWIMFPLVRRPFCRLPDQGWFLSRWAGLFLLSWAGWMLNSVGLAATWPRGIVVALVLPAGLAWMLRTRPAAAQPHPASRLWIAGGEMLFWGVFGGFLFLRFLNPDLHHPSTGGEKPMELAILNAVLRAPSFPPADPWLAGHALNYYYFGYVPFAFLTRLTGLPASTGFNLAIPTLGAFAAVAALLVVAALLQSPSDRAADAGRMRSWSGPLRRFAGALWGPVLLIGIGNLYELRLLASGFRRLGAPAGGTTAPLAAPVWEASRGLYAWVFEGAAWPYSTASIYWNATRVIPHLPSEAAPITEFPLFSFLFADLHPHVIALPALLFLGLMLTTVGARNAGGLPGRTEWPKAVLVGAGLGTAALINPWDLPIALLVTIAATLAAPIGFGTRGPWIRLGISLTAGLLTLLPFVLTYDSPVGGTDLWGGSRTPLSAFLWIHGLFIFIIVWWLWSRQPPAWFGIGGGRRRFGASAWVWLAGVALLMLLSRLGWLPGAAVAVVPLVAALLIVLIRTSSDRDRKLAGLVLLGCLLVLVPEFLVLQGDIGRMNLVFKLYFEVWWLWSVACAVCLNLLLRMSKDSGGAWASGRRGWKLAFMVLLAASLVYPLLAIRARTTDRMEGAAGSGLDGLGSLADARYPLDGTSLELGEDLAVMRWLQREVTGRPVLVEAVTGDYGLGGRLSSASGLPTILGWPGHEIQQHQAQNLRQEMQQRRRDVARIYSEPTSESILPLIEQYGVRYVAVGGLERHVYGRAGLAKFRTASGVYWEPVFEAGGLVLYRVRPGVGPGGSDGSR